MRKILCLLTFQFLVLSSSSAQQAEQGIYPGITYDSDILGNVNLTTGSLAIDHNLLHLPQWKGFDIGDVQLQYNSTAWTLASYCGVNGCYYQWLPAGSNSNTGFNPPGPADGFNLGPVFNGLPSWSFTTVNPYGSGLSTQQLQVMTSDSIVHDMLPTGGGYRSIDGSNLAVNSTATRTSHGLQRQQRTHAQSQATHLFTTHSEDLPGRRIRMEPTVLFPTMVGQDKRLTRWAYRE
jgi:hypothetical protein